ncbi:MAG: hypothetical protein SO434_02685 [Eubacteriales bacterium]|nr:hypothetical protein [Eubacteriales bacterium]
MHDSDDSSLHFLAKQAKIRLQAKHETEQRKEIIARSFYKSREDIAYKTVEEIMEQQEVATNPIGRIIDDLLIVKIDDEVNKQRMVLQTSKWYKKLKDRYIKEKITK